MGDLTIMADKQISQLVAATTINNDDLFVLQQGGTAKKLTGQKLSDFVYASAADQIERVNEAVEQTQEAVDALEEQKNEIAQVVADMAQLGTDTTLTTPGMAADAAATGEVKDIALARFEQAEITGVPIATFDNGADNAPVKKLIVDIAPVQSGSGDPSPENVRPITGWTGANVMRSGKNLLDITGSISNTYADRIVTGGHVEITYKTTFSPNSIFVESQLEELKPFYLNAGEYTFSATVESGSDLTYTSLTAKFKYENGTIVSVNNGASFTLTDRAKLTELGSEYKSVTNGKKAIIDYQFECGTVATSYEPYQGETYSITFPSEAGAVYGGTLDVTNGVLTVTNAKVAFPTSGWTDQQTLTNTRRYSFSITGIKAVGSNNVDDILCTQYPVLANDSDTVHITHRNSNIHVFVSKEDYPNVTSWTNYLSEIETLPEVCYPLATPVTYTLTPTEIKTLLAINNIWADTGNINDLIYRKMPIPAEELEDTIESMIAGVEHTMEATQNYTEGDLVIAVHKLYHINSNIASGETLVPGVNCSVTTIEAELANLASVINTQLSFLGNVSTLTYQVVT